MIFFRQKHVFALLSILVAAFVVIAQIFANTYLLLVALACFGALVLWAALKGMVMPVLLFFLPWAPLLKLRPGTISIYTISLLAALVVYILRARRNINVFHFFPALLLLAETLVVKTFYDYSIDNSYILFFACLMLFPLLSKEKNGLYDFYSLTLFFSLGIIIAALSAKQLLVFPTISRYISVHSYQDLTRLAGYYGDPNFYSAHITAALAGGMVLLSKEAKRLRRIVLYVVMLLLLYCGFMSVSKSFALVTVCLFLFWILEVLFQKGKISLKLTLLLSIAVGGLFILSSTLFTNLIDMLLERFIGSEGSVSKLTTGRSDLWLSYINAMERDPLLLWFGKGYTDILVNGRASHNTILQSVYQLGLVGAVLLLAWLVFYVRSMLGSVKIKFSMWMQILILLMGAMGPWMALDMLFFYELFLLPFYVCIGINYLVQSDEKEKEKTAVLIDDQ